MAARMIGGHGKNSDEWRAEGRKDGRRENGKTGKRCGSLPPSLSTQLLVSD